MEPSSEGRSKLAAQGARGRDSQMLVNDLKHLCRLTVGEIREHLDKHCDITLDLQVTSVPPEAVRALLSSLGVTYDYQVIAITNLKGGVGKTVAATTIAARAAQYGYQVALLDLDPQGSATLAFDAEPGEKDPIFIDVWQAGDSLVSALMPVQENLWLLPSSLDNGLLDGTLASPVAQKSAVRNTCQVLKEAGFELIIVDCPPSLGAAVISAISAADTVVIPVTSDSYAIKGLRLSLDEIREICDTFGLAQPVIKVLLNRFDRREKLAHKVHDYLQEEFPELLLPAIIPTSTLFARALDRRKTVFQIPGTTAVKRPYDNLVRTLLGIELEREQP